MDESGNIYSEVDIVTEYTEPGRASSCFFTGHRKGLGNIIKDILPKMRSNISYLYSKGVTDFYVGGALGFDTIAAAQILDMKRDHPDMKLILYLPYRNQSESWGVDSKRFYEFALKNADEIYYAFDGEVYDYQQAKKYLLMRNRQMADKCAHCIAFYSGNKRSGTGYTIEYAKKSDCEIINLNSVR